MKAFISTVLKYDPKQKDLEGGILGLVKAYYGCVEAQGRGTLHCHMLIWVEGGLNPNEIKKRVLEDKDMDFQRRLLDFIDDSISNCIPEDPDPSLKVPSTKYHPCTVRGVDLDLTGAAFETARQKDIHHLAKQCQSHKHTGTCYKYWRGPPEPQECRFDLDEENTCPESSIDPDTGELNLRCLDGMVNNFNETILETMRCNMDIKFIGSGASAKAVMYYITDYITKSELKTHVAYAALELVVKKLEDCTEDDDLFTIRAKKLLQKCAYSMISHQELSAQQVCSYLMDYEDHFTSHDFKNLYWTSFERHVDAADPLPDTHTSAATELDLDIAPNEDNEISDNENDTGDDPDDPIEEERENDSAHTPEIGSDEVGIRTEEDGSLTETTSQVDDYKFRGSQLDDLCV
ncbi:hypothetical protein FPV67DRAFT_1401280, partial [Lyophyllum atratum]